MLMIIPVEIPVGSVFSVSTFSCVWDRVGACDGLEVPLNDVGACDGLEVATAAAFYNICTKSIKNINNGWI